MLFVYKPNYIVLAFTKYLYKSIMEYLRRKGGRKVQVVEGKREEKQTKLPKVAPTKINVNNDVLKETKVNLNKNLNGNLIATLRTLYKYMLQQKKEEAKSVNGHDSWRRNRIMKISKELLSY